MPLFCHISLLKQQCVLSRTFVIIKCLLQNNNHVAQGIHWALMPLLRLLIFHRVMPVFSCQGLVQLTMTRLQRTGDEDEVVMPLIPVKNKQVVLEGLEGKSDASAHSYSVEGASSEQLPRRGRIFRLHLHSFDESPKYMSQMWIIMVKNIIEGKRQYKEVSEKAILHGFVIHYLYRRDIVGHKVLRLRRYLCKSPPRDEATYFQSRGRVQDRSSNVRVIKQTNYISHTTNSWIYMAGCQGCQASSIKAMRRQGIWDRALDHQNHLHAHGPIRAS